MGCELDGGQDLRLRVREAKVQGDKRDLEERTGGLYCHDNLWIHYDPHVTFATSARSAAVSSLMWTACGDYGMDRSL